MTTKIKFTGNFLEYFIMSLGLLLLSVLTLGLALPYFSYWNLKYFFTKMKIENDDVVYTGNFWEYFIMSLGLLILSVLTFGLAIPYWIYWSVKYFFSKLEIREQIVRESKTSYPTQKTTEIVHQNQELKIIQDLKKQLKPNELIVQFKSNQEYKILKREQYLMDKELHLNNDYKVIDENLSH